MAAQIKELLLLKLTGAPKILGLDPFPNKSTILDFGIAGKRWPPLPLGWYFLVFCFTLTQVTRQTTNQIYIFRDYFVTLGQYKLGLSWTKLKFRLEFN